MYYGNAKASKEIIGGKQVNVDSQLEARVLHWLEDNGFHDRWRRTGSGTTVGRSHYTSDLLLAIEFEGRTQRAVVEIKPTKKHFTPYIAKRMLGVISSYKTNLLLLYTDREKTWYRIDPVNGSLSVFGQPVPGLLPLGKLPKTISLTSKKHAGRYYDRPFNPLGWLADLVIEIIQGPKKRPPRHKK